MILWWPTKPSRTNTKKKKDVLFIGWVSSEGSFLFLCILLAQGDGTPLQYSCLENPMDGGAWWAAVHGVTKSRTRLSDFTFTFPFHALEKECCWMMLNGLPWKWTNVIFEIAPKYSISDSFDSDGYSIPSNRFLPTVVDIMIIWIKFTHSSPV